MMRRDRLGAVAAAWLAVTMGALDATAQPTQPAGAQAPTAGDTCVTAYEEAQELRRQNRLVRARAELLLCQRACPTMLTRDCDRWLGEVDAAIPTVVLSARDARGTELSAVRVRVDGAPLVERLERTPVAVDPGSHTFVFERHAGGQPAEVRVSVPAGERARPVTATFPHEASTPALRRPPPTLSWVLGGVAVAGLGAGAVLGIKGHLDREAREEDCSPGCTDDDVDPIRVTWWVGGISAGVGAAAGIAAVWIWLAADTQPVANGAATGVRVTARPITGGGAAVLVGSF